MEYNNTKRLPIGVGKKIVEALKKQPKAYDEEFTNLNEAKGRTPNKEFYPDNTNFEQPYSSPKNQEKFNRQNAFNEYEESSAKERDYRYSPLDKTEDEEYGYEDNGSLYNQLSDDDYEIVEKYNKLKNKRQEYENYQFLDAENNDEEKSFRSHPPESGRKRQRQPVENVNNEFSSSIETLTKLIHQLPSGVTRQTGAQIIRQTMEAMGLSMNKVLTDAQQAQEGHAQKIKEHLNSIEEYKNNIRILEKELQKNKKRVDDLDDIISLFILTEKEKKKQI